MVLLIQYSEVIRMDYKIGSYVVEELNIEGEAHQVLVSFEMSYPDWLKFQKS